MISATVFALMAVGQVALPGSHMDSRQAYAEAHTIVVAEVTGFGLLHGVGTFWCTNSLQLKPSAVLKGDAGEGPLKGLSMQGSDDELFTKPGEVHIFFIGEYKGRPKILKVLPKTDENLAAIRAMGD